MYNNLEILEMLDKLEKEITVIAENPSFISSHTSQTILLIVCSLVMWLVKREIYKLRQP